MLQIISREDIRLVYTFVRKLGKGSFGTVRIAHKTAVDEDKNFAVKSIRRDLIEESKTEAELTQELLILQSIDHPNIVKLHEIYLDHEYLHIVTELVEGGEVDPSKEANGRYTEQQAARMIRQALLALKYLHDLGIVHRDMKIENMLQCKNRQFVKLIDFGLALFMNQDSKETLSDMMGTRSYMAPEVIRGKYDKRCDLWSLGVITYVILSGSFPFWALNSKQLEQ